MKLSFVILSVLAVDFAAGRLERRSSTLSPWWETVSVTVNGKPTQVTHTVQAAYATDEAKDETIEFTPDLAKDINDYFANCNPPNSAPAKRTPPTGTNNHLTGPLRLPDCYKRTVALLIKELVPTGKLFSVITSVRNYVFELTGHALKDPIVNQFQDAAAKIPDLSALPEAVRNKAVNTLVLAGDYINTYGNIAGQFMVDNSLYLEDPPKENGKEGCPWGQDTPTCEDQRCKGIYNPTIDEFACVGGSWDICRCRDIERDQIWEDPFSFAALGYGLDQLKKIGAVGPPQKTDPRHCNPTSTNKWTSGDAASQAVDQFCANNDYLSGKPGDVHENRYNPGTPNEVILRSSWPKSGPIQSITTDDCKNDFKAIIDCPPDAHDDPANLKYGGTYQDPNGPTLEIAPFVGEPNDVCNRHNDGTANPGNLANKYVDAPEIYNNIDDFCHQQANKKIESLQSIRYNDRSDSLETFDFTVESGLGYVVVEEDCKKNLKELADNCDPDIGNPNNYKFGGIRGVGSVKWTIDPQKVRKMPFPTSHNAQCLLWTDRYDHPWKYEISGNGWSSNGFDDIKKRVGGDGGCGQTRDDWGWTYSADPDKDGWEWRGYAVIPRVTTDNNNCIAEAIAASGGDQVGCGGDRSLPDRFPPGF
ncbi:MAG: hypothetical protein Q9160_007522 [Pyrenula sp. 1 TL-2023]